MLSPQKIEMHFQEIKSLSEQIKGLSEEIRRKSQEEFLHVVSHTKQVWNSECADLLTGKEVRLGGQLAEEADELLKIAEKMEKQAEEMYRMEKVNQLLAETRIYL